MKNIKPKDLDKTGLEKSIHAPSPLITGKLTEMADSRNQLMNSPDVRLGPGVTMKKASKFGGQIQQAQTNQTSGQHEESDDIDVISDEKTSINQNIKNYQNVGLNNIIGRMKDPINGIKEPEEGSNIMKKVEQKTQKKALGVQSNLLNFLKKNQPENQMQFTLNNNSEKANNVKNILRDMEK